MNNTLCLLSILLILLSSCKDEVINSTQATQDHLMAENIFNDVQIVIEDGLTHNGENKSCPSYMIKNTNNLDPDTIIINFGNGDPNCISYNNLKSGKVIVVYNGKYRDSLSVITSTFDDYYVNSTLVQGSMIISNKGRNNSGNICFDIEINNASINTSEGLINWSSKTVREWTHGSGTYEKDDDHFRISGTASGIGRNNNNFSMMIKNNLEIDMKCIPNCIIKSGTAEIKPNGYAKRLINYGDSICDCNAEVTVNESIYPIQIN